MVKKKNTNYMKPIIITIICVIAVLFIIPVFMLLFIGLLFAGAGSSDVQTSGNVAIIPISGIILTSGSPWDSSVTSSKHIVDMLEDIKKDNSIKAVIFEINSPGGSGVASDEISQAIKELEKPTASYIREAGASGSYWIASATDKIYANRFSTVGSIGVIASYLEFSGLLTEYNVTYQRFVAGENKDFGSPFREPTQAERTQYQELLDSLHSIFIQEVANNRGVSYEHIEELADGSIYTGIQAVDNKLVDAIGGEKDAIAYIENELGIKAKTAYYGREATIFDILSGVHQESLYTIGQGIGQSLVKDDDIGFRT